MKNEKEIEEKIKFLEKGRRNCTICFIENHGILNAINAYANDKWIDALKWVLDKEVSEWTIDLSLGYF